MFASIAIVLDGGVTVKSDPVTLAPFTGTARLDGVKEYPLLLGVTV
jgi:hypothetical protein